MDQKLISLHARLGDFRTNHVLHLLLTIITGGLWGFVWVAQALVNYLNRLFIRNRINKLTKVNIIL